MLVGIGGAEPQAVAVTRIIEHDEITLRIPVQPRPMGPLVQFVERPGPRCIQPNDIVGAALGGANSVDFLLRGRRRMRAEVDEDCDGLDFYGGFYVQPEGGRICAGVDEIRSRMGGSCRIEAFHQIVPRLVR
ncbi:hypothetical protein [Sphingomonas ginkgonis]|nr:hypothetical protein [Sphingomonas ginkgonis]